MGLGVWRFVTKDTITMHNSSLRRSVSLLAILGLVPVAACSSSNDSSGSDAAPQDNSAGASAATGGSGTAGKAQSAGSAGKAAAGAAGKAGGSGAAAGGASAGAAGTSAAGGTGGASGAAGKTSGTGGGASGSTGKAGSGGSGKAGAQGTAGTSPGAGAGGTGPSGQGGSSAGSGPAGAAGVGGSSVVGGGGAAGGDVGAAGAGGSDALGGAGGSDALGGAGGSAAGGPSAGGMAGTGGSSSSFSSIHPTPTPIISRGKPSFAKSTNSNNPPSVLADGLYHEYTTTWFGGSPTPSAPSWWAAKLGAGPTRLLLSWSDSGSYNYLETDYGAPGGYRIETSGDTTNGSDGTWSVVATVTGNQVRSRAHSFDFTGKSWVRFVVTETPANSASGVQIDEIDIHDLSASTATAPNDTWFFMGDSITAFAYDRAPAHQPSYATSIGAKHTSYFPAMINGGIGGESSVHGVAHIDQWLALNPDYSFFALAYGTNDAAGNNPDTTTYRKNMQTIIDHVKAAGRIPILARIPYAIGGHDHLPDFNKVVDELTVQNGLPPGPDLYTWFFNHQNELLSDNLHPNDTGRQSINRLWAEAMDAVYQ